MAGITTTRRPALVVPPKSAPERAGVSVIVPTFREAANLPRLIGAIAEFRASGGHALDLWIMDDASRDGSAAVVDAAGFEWVHFVERPPPRGLSISVLDGIRRSTGGTIVVMDADLSHPPAAIGSLLAALDQGAEMAFGSRYVAGGATDDGWGLHRRLNSAIATLLARPLTRLRDPMSGFFALRRSVFDRAVAPNPIGYKIGLELVVKCDARQVVEVPIHFANRHAGKSKLTPMQQVRYLEHLRRLYIYKLRGGPTRGRRTG